MDLVNIDDTKQELLERLDTLRNTMRRSVEQSWAIGESLCRLKAEMGHGNYLDYLDQIGLPDRTARSFTSLYNKYTQIGKLCRFDTVQAAMLADPQEIEEAWSYIENNYKRFMRDTKLKCGIVLPGLEKTTNITEVIHEEA